MNFSNHLFLLKHVKEHFYVTTLIIRKLCGEKGIRTPGTLITFVCFQDKCNRPLCHLSIILKNLVKTCCLSFTLQIYKQFLKKSSFFEKKIKINFVGTVGFEPTCNRLPFLRCIRLRGYIPIFNFSLSKNDSANIQAFFELCKFFAKFFLFFLPY